MSSRRNLTAAFSSSTDVREAFLTKTNVVILIIFLYVQSHGGHMLRFKYT